MARLQNAAVSYFVDREQRNSAQGKHAAERKRVALVGINEPIHKLEHGFSH
jgi:hypothetical protein